ncbi:unnamed protein product [Linum trigynum]|uniref:Uncharacterized protein n=1 Tax=Linum trigynum TaxID=586398 RepID=A0AAV2CXX6_9ROSI
MYRSKGKVPFAWENKPGIPKRAAGASAVEVDQAEDDYPSESGEFVVLQGALAAAFPPSYPPSARGRPLTRHVAIPPPPPPAHRHRLRVYVDADPFAAALEECKRPRSKKMTKPSSFSSSSSSSSTSASGGERGEVLVSVGARWRKLIALSGFSCRHSAVLDVYDCN